jgi:hypothetical protein
MSSVEDVCPICLSKCEQVTTFVEKSGAGAGLPFDLMRCPRCGKFEAEHLFKEFAQNNEGKLGHKGSRTRADLSAFIRERQSLSDMPPQLLNLFLDTKKNDPLGDYFWNLPPKTFHQRADKLLKEFSKKTEGAGQRIDYNFADPQLQASCWALDSDELYEIVMYLEKVAFIEDDPEIGMDSPKETRILPDGWKRLEELEKEGPELVQGFIAMWFDPSMDILWERALIPAIEKSGYAPLYIPIL